MGNGLSRVGVIARREYWSTVRRREFLLVTFGLPLLYLFIVLIVFAASLSAMKTVTEREKQDRPSTLIGFHSAAPPSLLSSAALIAGSDGITGQVFDNDADGQAAVRAKDVRAYVSIPADYAETGQITIYLPPKRESIMEGGSNAADDDLAAIAHTLRRALLKGKTDAATTEAVMRPVDSKRLYWDAKEGRFAKPDPLRSVARFVIPYAFSALLMMSVIFTSTYLLHGVVDEKENRIIEVLLSAVSSEQLLFGKLIGLGGAGLTQLGIWLLPGLLIASVARSIIPMPAGLSLSAFSVGPGLIAVALALYICGYALYAALTVGIGSFGTSWRESQQIAGLLAMFLVIPVVLLPVMLDEPGGIVARIVSFVPLTAPVGMMLRVSVGGASVVEVIACVLLLIGATVLAVRLAASLFRLSLLLTGQRPTIPVILRSLRGETLQVSPAANTGNKSASGDS